MKERLRKNRLLADTLGYGCLIGVPLIGWLPGPGGIPLLLTGLSLLSIHNPWAQKATNYVKKHSTRVREIIFPPEKHIMIIWDIFCLVLLITSLYLVLVSSHYALYLIGTATLFASFTVLLCNRGRLEAIKTLISK